MKKKILSFLLAAVMLLSTLAVLPITASAEDPDYRKFAQAYYNRAALCWYNEELGSCILFNMIGEYSPMEDTNQYFFSYATTDPQGNLRWCREPIMINKNFVEYMIDPSTYDVTLSIPVDELGLLFMIQYCSTNYNDYPLIVLDTASQIEGLVDPELREAEYTRMPLNLVLGLFDGYTFVGDNIQVFGGRDGSNNQTLDITFGERTTSRTIDTFLYGMSDSPEYDYCIYYKGNPLSLDKFYFNLTDAGTIDTLVFTDGAGIYEMNKLNCDEIWEDVLPLTFKPTGAAVQDWNGNILFTEEGVQRKMTLPNGTTINVDTDLIVSDNKNNQYKLALKSDANVYFVYRTVASTVYLDLYQNGAKTQTFLGGFDISAIWNMINGKVYTNDEKSYTFTEDSGKKYVVVDGTNYEIDTSYIFRYTDSLGYFLITEDEDRAVIITFNLDNGKINSLSYYPDFDNDRESHTDFKALTIDSVWNLINGRSYFNWEHPTITFGENEGAKCITFLGNTEEIDAVYNVSIDENGNYVLTKRSNMDVTFTLTTDDDGKIISIVYDDKIQSYDDSHSGTYTVVTLGDDMWEAFKDETYKEYFYGEEGDREYGDGFIFFYENDGKKYAKLNGTEEIDLDACAVAEISSRYSYLLTLADGRTLGLYRGDYGSSNTVCLTDGETETYYSSPDFSDIDDQLNGTFVNGDNSIIFAIKTDDEGWEGLFISVNGLGGDEPAFFRYWLVLDEQGRYVLVSEDEESGATTTLTLVMKNSTIEQVIYNDGNGDVTYVSPNAQQEEESETGNTEETGDVEETGNVEETGTTETETSAPETGKTGTEKTAEDTKEPEFPIETVNTSKDELKEGVSVTEVFTRADSAAEDTGVEIKIGGETENAGSIVFTPDAIAQIVAAIGSGDAKLKVEIETDVSKIETSGKIDAETAEQVQLVVELDLGGVEFSKGEAEISLPFTATIPEGKCVVIYYVDANGNMTALDTEYKNGMITFATTHFSTYIAVFEDAPAKGGISAGAVIGIIIGAIVLLAIIAYVAFFFMWKKNEALLPAFLGFLAPSYNAINKALFEKEAKTEEKTEEAAEEKVEDKTEE